MKINKCLLVGLLALYSIVTQAEEITPPTEEKLTTAYISDDLFIYMHAGPGNNYRILGSINAGDEVEITGSIEGDYTQIVDNKGRTTWVESKYVSTTPGLRTIIAELNSKLADSEDINKQAASSLDNSQNEIEQLRNNTKQLNSEISALKQQLVKTEAQLSNQDLDLKKEYFYNGAMVLAFGLLLGIILPRLSARKKGSMESWK